jgi:predicted nucleotidyltransferase
MPVRSLSSSVLVWPPKSLVEPALAAWALELSTRYDDLLAVGYFGSYARGDWGVGSDLDLIVILQQSQSPFGRRSVPMETRMVPVPVDMLVYTQRELEEMMQRGGSFPAMLRAEALWVWRRSDFHGLPS